MSDAQQIIDEIEKAKQKLIDSRNSLKESQIALESININDENYGLDIRKEKQLIHKLDNELNDALLNLIVKKD